jgi:hypothetical protein
MVCAVCIFLSLISEPSFAQKTPVKFSDILPQIEAILSDLSSIIDEFEDIQRTMDRSGKANQNYNQQKNIFLSSQLAVSTISLICDYETDLMTLFIDLREKNRQKFYAVRIESLEIAVRQINTMHKQIQINYTILPPSFFEAPLVRKERLAIQNSLDLLNQMIELLKFVNRKK